MFKQMTELIDLPVSRKELEQELGSDWPEIKDDPKLVRGYAETIAVNRQRRDGKVPEGWTRVFECAGCGPVYLTTGGPKQISACPWCINRAEGLPIPEAI